MSLQSQFDHAATPLHMCHVCGHESINLILLTGLRVRWLNQVEIYDRIHWRCVPCTKSLREFLVDPMPELDVDDQDTMNSLDYVHDQDTMDSLDFETMNSLDSETMNSLDFELEQLSKKLNKLNRKR